MWWAIKKNKTKQKIKTNRRGLGFLDFVGFVFLIFWFVVRLLAAGLGGFFWFSFNAVRPRPVSRACGGRAGAAAGPGPGVGCARRRAWCRGGDAATPPSLPSVPRAACRAPRGRGRSVRPSGWGRRELGCDSSDFRARLERQISV